ncbi:MAG: DEAD/DEAH box helicase family protein, partial [Microcystaceae cyanobacterium]
MNPNLFQLQAPFQPTGDQPTAIAGLVQSLQQNNRFQTLLGATGTGKTFTMAAVIEQIGRPTLVLAHNKTLAAQLCNELRQFFPENAVEYFISYYDYYQPEAYIPVTDTYIEKTASINEEIDMLRHSATRSLFERKDVIVVASISCIYGLGMPAEYLKAAVPLQVGVEKDPRQLIRDLVTV